jgi:hypothetical protein
MRTSIRILATTVLFLALAGHVQEGTAADQESSVAIISSVHGEARIVYPTPTQQPDLPKFRGPIIYGDHLSTGKDSSLGLLVGTTSLLTMRELSEVRIAETGRNKQILEVAKGKVCLAVSRSTDLGAEPFTVRTPTSLITARDGTLLSIDVEEPKHTSRIEDPATHRVVMAAMSGQAPNASAVETIHVIEGSVDIVSLAPGSSATSLRTGQSLRVVGGVRGQPFASAPISCRAQDIQINPVHATTPAAAQQRMVRQQMQLASAEPIPPQGVAAMSQVAAAGLSGMTVPGGLYLSYTDSGLNGPTTPATIQVTIPVEVAP